MKKNVAIGIVTYSPSESLALRLQIAVEAGFTIYLFDNSPKQEFIRLFCQGSGSELIKYLTCGKNVGLGFGISAVCAQAYYESHKALVFFDQDTVFDKTTLNFIEDFYVNQSDLSAEYSAVVFNAKNNGAFRDVVFAISSGSLFFLENLKKMNWHNENYFVDCVDYEFCLRSANNNLKIGEWSVTPGFDHQTEQADVKYNILGKERLLRKYSLMRILDTTQASGRLLFYSIGSLNFIYFKATLRWVVAYFFWQSLVRIINVFNPRNRKIK